MAKLEEYELLAEYDEFINDTTELIDIWGMKYEPSNVLKECDPIAYRVGFHDWLDSLDDCEDCDNNPIDCECEEE